MGSIAMDFIFDLPRTSTRNDGIWTIICRFSKQAHFVHVRKKIKSEHMVKLFMHNVFKYHGMPQSIVSDRDPRMTSLFWKALFENMGSTLKFSSSFHPQTDGQSKEANSTILDLLKCYVSEHKATWEHYLPLVEYAYNNIVHTSTGKVPFEIVEGGKKDPFSRLRTRYLRQTSLTTDLHDKWLNYGINSPLTRRAGTNKLGFPSCQFLGNGTLSSGSSRRAWTSRQRHSVGVARCETNNEKSNSLDIWLGRAAMLGFVGVVSFEVATGKGVLENAGLVAPLPTFALALAAVVGVVTAFGIFWSANNDS
ncbi:hypothetical protein L7F22_041490 [Adiantum nelumboides]|nr:hypothetical protein [Adiantum nelumboides]